MLKLAGRYVKILGPIVVVGFNPNSLLTIRSTRDINRNDCDALVHIRASREENSDLLSAVPDENLIRKSTLSDEISRENGFKSGISKKNGTERFLGTRLIIKYR